MNFRNKSISIILLCLTIVLITVLSSELSRLTFQPGKSYIFQSEDIQVDSGDGAPRLFDLGGLGRVVGIIILWVILPASVVYFIISPTARRQVILRVLSISFSTFAMIIIVRWLATSGGCSNIQNATVVSAGEGGGEITEVVFTPWDLPSFRYLGSLIMAVIIVAILYRAWRRIRLQRPGQLDKIAQKAESAVADLQAGADLEDTIKRCYFEMSMALQNYHGLEREIGMTPREFEASLHGMGLPLGNVQRLTHLFEEVRYGAKVLGENVEREAIDLLNAIVMDCQMHRPEEEG
jgi:hypothetical protein